MKNEHAILKSIKGTGTDHPAKPLPPGALYVVFVNKPLINLWAITDLHANDYYDSVLPGRATAYLKSNSALDSQDRIPVILSQEEEMLLYNDGLFD